MQSTPDMSFIRITPKTETRASIQCYFKDPKELREELQRVAYDVYYTLNVCPNHSFIAYSKGMNDIEVHSVFGKDKRYMYDIIVHGFDDTNDLIEYLCEIANSLCGVAGNPFDAWKKKDEQEKWYLN